MIPRLAVWLQRFSSVLEFGVYKGYILSVTSMGITKVQNNDGTRDLKSYRLIGRGPALAMRNQHADDKIQGPWPVQDYIIFK